MGLALLLRPSVAAASPVTRATLDNGLRVVVRVEPGRAQVAVGVSYLAGEVDDRADVRGVARLLERMMFAGSAGVKDGQHRHLIEAVGGRTEVRRTPEVTSYLSVVPVAFTNLALWLEADRMASLALAADTVARESKRLVAERDREPPMVGIIVERPLLGLALQGAWGYRAKPLADLEQVDAAALRSFHAERYAPGRAVVVVAGPVAAEAAIEAVRRYFGGIVRASSPASQPPGTLQQQSRRSLSLRATGSQSGALALGFAASGRSASRAAALDIAGQLLAGSAGSLAARLVTPGKALAVGYRVAEWRQATLLELWVELPRGTKPAALAADVDAELRRLVTTPVTGARLAAAKRRLHTRWRRRLARDASRAHLLGVHELCDGDADALYRRVAAVDAVDAEELRGLAGSLLLDHLGSTVELWPVPILPDEDDE